MDVKGVHVASQGKWGVCGPLCQIPPQTISPSHEISAQPPMINTGIKDEIIKFFIFKKINKAILKKYLYPYYGLFYSLFSLLPLILPTLSRYLYKVSQKSAMWRNKNEWLSISFLEIFFPTFPLISLIFMTSRGWFLSHFVPLEHFLYKIWKIF